MVRKYRGKTFHIISVKRDKRGRRYVHGPTGRPRFIKESHLLKPEHLKDGGRAGGGLHQFMKSLGHTLSDPRKWAIVQSIDPKTSKQYWENQKWGLQHSGMALAYAAGRGVELTGHLLQVPQKLLNKAGKSVLGTTPLGRKITTMLKTKAGKVVHGIAKFATLAGDLDVVGDLMEQGGRSVAKLGEADQRKFEEHIKKSGGGLASELHKLWGKLSYKGNDFVGY